MRTLLPHPMDHKMVKKSTVASEQCFMRNAERGDEQLRMEVDVVL